MSHREQPQGRDGEGGAERFEIVVGDGATLGRVKKEVFPTAPARSSLQAVWHDSVALERGAGQCIRAEMCRCGKVADALWPGQGSGQQSGLCRDGPNR